MKKINIGKITVLGITTLLVGIATAPSLHANINDISTNEELEEVVIEIVGVKDSVQNTIKLSKKQIQEIDDLFENIKNDLDNTETTKESNNIFNNALIELENYGLLSDITSEKTQKEFFESRKNKINTKLESLLKKIGVLNDNISCLCRIVGKATNTFFGRFSLIYLSSLLYHDIPPLPLPLFFLVVIFWGLTAASLVPWLICTLLQFELREFISFGFLEPGGYGFHPVPSEGWVRTKGLFRNKNTTGEFLGKIPFFPIFIGALGFTGIKIKVGGDYCYFLGFASLVMV